MKRLIILASFTLISACSGEARVEVDAIAACDTYVEAGLIVPESFEAGRTRKYHLEREKAYVERTYAAESKIGLKVHKTYSCLYDTVSRSVIALETDQT